MARTQEISTATMPAVTSSLPRNTVAANSTVNLIRATGRLVNASRSDVTKFALDTSGKLAGVAVDYMSPRIFRTLKPRHEYCIADRPLLTRTASTPTSRSMAGRLGGEFSSWPRRRSTESLPPEDVLSAETSIIEQPKKVETPEQKNDPLTPSKRKVRFDESVSISIREKARSQRRLASKELRSVALLPQFGALQHITWYGDQIAFLLSAIYSYLLSLWTWVVYHLYVKHFF